MKQTTIATVMVATVLIALAMSSTQALAASVTITDAWIRALPGNLPASGYFTLQNGTEKTVTLTGAESPACGMVMLHKSETMNGMSSMSDVASIDVPAGATVKFAPVGYHLMCMGPTPALKPGASVPVTVEFVNGMKLTAPFAVRNATGQ